MLLPLIVLNALHLEHYVLSMAFGAMSTWLSDPGGNYGLRVRVSSSASRSDDAASTAPSLAVTPSVDTVGAA